MSTADKRIAQMRTSPKGDWRIEDLETVATALGMKVRKSGGSHAVFSHPATAVRLTVPIKPVYIRHFIDMIDEIRGAS
jgi:predicted RNA binding protein YcfA (HicA-like mRNA interferase family)